jgi:hypothetical protein
MSADSAWKEALKNAKPVRPLPDTDMTVAQLIDALKKFPPELKVMVTNSQGHRVVGEDYPLGNPKPRLATAVTFECDGGHLGCYDSFTLEPDGFNGRPEFAIREISRKQIVFISPVTKWF